MSPRGGPGVPRPRVPRPHAEKFMEKVAKDASGCWLWQGYIDENGYGDYRHEQTRWAHRASWLIFRGPIADGLTIDHLCRVKTCVNPDHLEPVPQSENVKRAKPWTKCADYHPDSPSRWATRPGGRQRCLECGRVAEQRRRDSRALMAANVWPTPHAGGGGG